MIVVTSTKNKCKGVHNNNPVKMLSRSRLIVQMAIEKENKKSNYVKTNSSPDNSSKYGADELQNKPLSNNIKAITNFPDTDVENRNDTNWSHNQNIDQSIVAEAGSTCPNISASECNDDQSHIRKFDKSLSYQIKSVQDTTNSSNLYNINNQNNIDCTYTFNSMSFTDIESSRVENMVFHKENNTTNFIAVNAPVQNRGDIEKYEEPLSNKISQDNRISQYPDHVEDNDNIDCFHTLSLQPPNNESNGTLRIDNILVETANKVQNFTMKDKSTHNENKYVIDKSENSISNKIKTAIFPNVNYLGNKNIFNLELSNYMGNEIHQDRNFTSSQHILNTTCDNTETIVCSNKKNILDHQVYEFHSDSTDNDFDDSRDKDFNMSEYDSNSSSESSECSSGNCREDNLKCEIKSIHKLRVQRLPEIIKHEREKKFIQCRYCTQDIATKKFMRHLERQHKTQKEVKRILEHPKKSNERRHAMNMLRNDTNFNLFLKGTIRPNRNPSKSSVGIEEDITYYPCSYCKGLFAKQYLKRHTKKCTVFKNNVSTDEQVSKINHLSRSQTFTACAIDPTNVISQLNVKTQVFDIMKGDNIAFEAKKDLLISHFGNSYLKKHKRERMAYACSTRMRELSRLLIGYRKITKNENICLKDLLHPQCFDTVICAVRNIVGYDPNKKTFKSPSLAMHLGTSLKLVCAELTHLILKESDGFQCQTKDDYNEWLQDIKKFRKLVEARWGLELASLAHKDLKEKQWNKPLLLPLVSDIKTFRVEVLHIANKCKLLFDRKQDTKCTYKELVQCILALLIIFNRRRIGDVQFLKINDYKTDNRTNYADFESLLTNTEKVLTKKYKRVLNSGKGSRAVVVLIPEIIQEYINVLLENRPKYIQPDNEYLFAMPDSTIKWGKGDVAIRSLTKKIKLENPRAISSNKLRKQIATVMQLLNLNKQEAKQFSDFMGHTQKTHEEFYELPVDIYQTAKVSKILLMMEKGNLPAEYKGKALNEINFDINLEYAEENVAEDDVIVKSCEENLNLVYSDTIPMAVEHTASKSGKGTGKTKLFIDDMQDKKMWLRKGWSKEETDLVQDRFKEFIDNGIYPTGHDIKVFINEHNIQRKVPTIKAKIQHIIKLKHTRNAT